MNKKNTTQIKDYYAKKDVVAGYDQRRFSGKGGGYINETEIGTILTSLSSLNLKKGAKVLDLGAGRGRLSLPLKKAGYEVYCLDSSEEMIKTLGKQFPKNHLILQSIFEPLKVKEKFDVITSMRFFDHFDIKDQKKILENVSKKLSKNGYIVYATLNKGSLESSVSQFFPYGRYNYFYTDDQYRKLFKSAKLEVVEVKSAFILPRGSFLYLQKVPGLAEIMVPMDKLVSKAVPQSGAYLVYLLKKS